jgi:hypothetical protein
MPRGNNTGNYLGQEYISGPSISNLPVGQQSHTLFGEGIEPPKGQVING